MKTAKAVSAFRTKGALTCSWLVVEVVVEVEVVVVELHVRKASITCSECSVCIAHDQHASSGSRQSGTGQQQVGSR